MPAHYAQVADQRYLVAAIAVRNGGVGRADGRGGRMVKFRLRLGLRFRLRLGLWLRLGLRLRLRFRLRLGFVARSTQHAEVAFPALVDASGYAGDDRVEVGGSGVISGISGDMLQGHIFRSAICPADADGARGRIVAHRADANAPFAGVALVAFDGCDDVLDGFTLGLGRQLVSPGVL
jgi:hypothetical protein